MYQLERFLKRIYWERFSWEFFSSEKWDGYDLEDFREYQVWDNVKKINWKLSAKYDKEYISIYKKEKEPVVDIFVDLSKNVVFFSENVTKFLWILDLLIKNLWIRKNIYVFSKFGFIKNKTWVKVYQNIQDIVLKWWYSSCINEIIYSHQFKNKTYKIVISDFIDLENIDELSSFYNKSYFASVPLLKLLESGSFATLNWFFDKNISTDLIKEYKNKLEKLNSNFIDIDV